MTDPSPLPSGPDGTDGALFAPLFSTAAVDEAVGDRALLAAMLEAEAALARAGAAAGLVPPGAAAAIGRACAAGHLDAAAIGRASSAAGNPVPALVRALTAAVRDDPAQPEAASREAAGHVHRGATSQDIVDTALVLVARRALGPLLADLDAVAGRCAELAARHRDDVIAGRTLLQQAVPTTFGAKAAAWLVGVADARADLAARGEALPAQLGGAAGTLASLGDAGVAVLEAYASELGLPAPALPWHTVRTPLASLAAALGVAAGALAKIATDVALLAQTEVAEVSEDAAGGRGGSSTMPHKRNPIGAVLAAACARRAPGLVATVLAAMAQEHERAAGGWHAEWEPLRDLLRVTAGAAGHVRGSLGSLSVDPRRMRANADLTGGLALAENLATRLSPALGRLAAHDLVDAAVRRAVEEGRSLRDAALADPEIAGRLSEADVDDALDPASYLGSAGAFVDRALAARRLTAPPPAP